MTEAEWRTCGDPDLLLEVVVGKISRQQLICFVRGCWRRIERFIPTVETPYTVVEQFASVVVEQSDMDAARYASEAALKAAAWSPAIPLERRQQAELLRHLVGNPFRASAGPRHFSATARELARALAVGQDCGFALHDALLEDGNTELAKHFRQPGPHPEGCWALQLILDDADHA